MTCSPRSRSPRRPSAATTSSNGSSTSYVAERPCSRRRTADMAARRRARRKSSRASCCGNPVSVAIDDQSDARACPATGVHVTRPDLYRPVTLSARLKALPSPEGRWHRGRCSLSHRPPAGRAGRRCAARGRPRGRRRLRSPAAAAPGSDPTAVVALGDSAISGEGAGAYEPGTNGPGGDFCHRSTRALIQQTTIPGIQNRISLACSGAASSDVRINGTRTTPSRPGRPAAHRGPRQRREDDRAADRRERRPAVRRHRALLRAGVGQPVRAGAARPHWRPSGRPGSRRWRRRSRRSSRRAHGHAPGRVRGLAYQFVLQSYASPFTENMNSITHAFEGCPLRLSDAKFARTQAVGQLSAALRGVAQRTGVRFLDLARATEGREACNRSMSAHWITPLTSTRPPCCTRPTRATSCSSRSTRTPAGTRSWAAA